MRSTVQRVVVFLVVLATSFVCVQNARAQVDAPFPIRGGLINVPRGDQFALTELSPTVYVDDVGGNVRGQIDRVGQLVKAEQWLEAIDMLVRLSESSDRRLTASSEKSKPGFLRYTSIPQFVNEQLSIIAHQSSEALQQYRQRVDPLAEQWLGQALEENDGSLLKKIVQESLNSSVGDDALLALGDRALEAGETGAARRYWNAIHPQLQWQNNQRTQPYWHRLAQGNVVSSVAKDLERDVSIDVANGTNLSTYIGSDIPLADVWARLTLASILEGNKERASLEIAVIRKLWKKTTGQLGGREVTYLKFLSKLLNESRRWPKPKQNEDWPTFAGNADRNLVTATKIDIPVKPNWRVPLLPAEPLSSQASRTYNVPREKVGEVKDQPSSHFPIVVGNLVFVHDENRIRCLQIVDGKPAWSAEDSDGAFFTNAETADSAISFSTFDQQPLRLGEPRFTLSAAGKTLLATLGSHRGSGGSGNPALIGFDLSTEGGVQFGPVEIEDGNWSFHGAPVCDENRCWVGLRLRDASAQDFVACFDTSSGKELWRTRICSADTIGHNSAVEVSNYLLTKHEETIYCSSHLGTVAALSAHDGNVRWLTTYPRQGPKRENLLSEPWHTLRDLTPCLYHDGLLILAPSDTNKIFALHADSGKLLWETEFGGDANQLLGVGEENHLIVSGRRLWWLDAYTGSLSRKVSVNPFPSNGISNPNGAGRGVLSGGNVYWPTVDDDGIGRIFVLGQAKGKPRRQPIDLEAGNVKAGNLVVTPKYLLVASADELVAYRIDTR